MSIRGEIKEEMTNSHPGTDFPNPNDNGENFHAAYAVIVAIEKSPITAYILTLVIADSLVPSQTSADVKSFGSS